MFRHYLTVALRQLTRNKFYSSISVIGLALGLASVFLIIQYVEHELSYDLFHRGAENIYRIVWINTNSQTRTPHPMAQAMVQDFPEVESAVSLSPLWGPGLTKQVFSVRNPEKNVRYDESNVLAVDSTFFKVFSFQLIKGDPKTALKDPGGILISESIAQKYFNTTDCLGKQLQANEEKDLLQVVGVFKDVPQTSHFHFDFLVSYVREKNPHDNYYQWGDFGHYNYIKLKPGTDVKALENRLLDWTSKYVRYREEEVKWIKEHSYGFELQPLTSIHLKSHLRWELEANGNIAYVYLMSAAALLILIIGVFNFVNLSLAQATERTKEIGLRKSLGAFKHQLAFQFLGEAAIVTLSAIVFAIVFIEATVPLFKSLTGFALSLDWGILIFTLLLLGILVAITTSVYPAIVLSSYKPALILKNNFVQSKGLGGRRIFIVIQFITTMAMISSSVIISQQIYFLSHKEIGFKPEEVIVLPIKDRAMNSRIEELRTALLQINGVRGVSASSNIPGKSFNQNPIYAINNPEERRDASEEMIDVDFLKVMGMKIVEGRAFLKGNPADSSGFILNETAVHQLGIKEPVGTEILWERDGPEIRGKIIGVVKDFNFQSLHEPLRPVLMRLENSFNFVIVKVNTSNFASAISQIEKSWRKFDQVFRFEFFFLDEQLNHLYKEEQNMATVLYIFSTLGVMIACIGLLGIASLSFRQRIKEVSIRKILGATLPNLFLLLLKDFTQLVLIAIVIATPLAWWTMNNWLQNFSYRVKISPLVFIATGTFLLIISWITLIFLTAKTARINPAETLKNE